MPPKKASKMKIRTNSSSKPPSPIVDRVNPMPALAFATKSKNKFKCMMEQIEKDKNLTVKERFDIFLSETSFTALTKIFKAGTIIKQIIWLVLVMAMISWLCIQCYWLFAKYFAYPVEVKIELIAKQKMDFPSVTVCNRNPVRKSQMMTSPFYAVKDIFEMKQDKSLYDMAVTMMQNTTAVDDISLENSSEEDLYIATEMKNKSFNVWSALNNWDTAYEFYRTTDQEMTATFVYATLATEHDPNELKSYGHQIEDFLVSCRFGGMRCSPENFTHVHNVKYGNCYTFNAFNNSLPTLHATYSGPLMGLVLELNVQQHEYIPALAPDAGVRVLVHSRGTFPALEDDGFSVPVGFMTSVGVKLTEITRLPPPHGSCAANGLIENLYMNRYGVQYEKSTCLKTCQQNIWKKKCGCVVAIYAIPLNSTVCDCKDESKRKLPLNSTVCDTKDEYKQMCLFNEMEKMIEECEIKCPTPCFERKYEPLISMATWPAEYFADYLDYKLSHTSLDFMGHDDEKADSDENVAKIEVYFREMMYEKIEQQKAYESQNLISDVGGQLGLWLGLSAITFGEMIEFFMAIFKAITAKAVRRRQRETAVESLENRTLAMTDFD